MDGTDYFNPYLDHPPALVLKIFWCSNYLESIIIKRSSLECNQDSLREMLLLWKILTFPFLIFQNLLAMFNTINYGILLALAGRLGSLMYHVTVLLLLSGR